MKNKKILIVSIIIFIIAAAVALYLVLNKGHVGTYALVSVEPVSSEAEVIIPQLKLELDKEYLSSKNKKETATMKVISGDEIVTEGVEFSSSDESVVKINDDNELVPVSDGKATITATYDGMDAKENIRVITPIKSMTFTSTNSTVRVGKDLQMKLKVTPSDAYIDTLQYSSSDEEIALVDNSGIVTGVAPGKVTITVYDTYTETEKKLNLTIRK